MIFDTFQRSEAENCNQETKEERINNKDFSSLFYFWVFEFL